MLTLLGTLFTNSTTAFAASPQAKISFWYASTKNSGEISELKAGYKHGKVLYAMLDGNSAYCIQNIMRYGRSDIDDEYFAIIKAEIEDFVDKVYNSIREFGYNLKTTPIVFVGGGAVVMKNFGSHDAKNISYNLDVKANARGYEQLATMGLKSTRRLS